MNKEEKTGRPYAGLIRETVGGNSHSDMTTWR